MTTAKTCEVCGSIYEPAPVPDTHLVTARTAGVSGGTGEAPECPHCRDDCEHLYSLFCGSTEGFGFCGCGSPEDAYDLVKAILGLAPFYQNWESGRSNGKMAQEVLGGHDGVWYFVLYAIDRTGLIEHGTSIGGSWLTTKGKHYLPLMQAHPWDSITAVGYPHDGEECPPSCRHWIASYDEWQRKAILEARSKDPGS